MYNIVHYALLTLVDLNWDQNFQNVIFLVKCVFFLNIKTLFFVCVYVHECVCEGGGGGT